LVEKPRRMQHQCKRKHIPIVILALLEDGLNCLNFSYVV
jgi:hypothetical protein